MSMNISMNFSKELDPNTGHPLVTLIQLSGDWEKRHKIQTYIMNLVYHFDLIQTFKDKSFNMKIENGKYIFIKEDKGIEYVFELYVGFSSFDINKTYSLTFYNQAVGNDDTRTVEYLGRSPKNKNEFDVLYNLLVPDGI